MPNRLAQETSPYLLQHKNNPVDWYPWGKEALDRARSEDKPILLSVGYSACHWCHVMEHESFENEATAKLMNEHFVCIKVDREERPDLDQIYQNVALAMTRGGGWPLTVFLTPELKPYFGGTYFPPEDRWGRPGFPRLLVALADAYRNDKESVAENAKRLTEYITAVESIGNETAADSIPSGESPYREAVHQILSRIDFKHGGFEGAPKFPNPSIFTFLWRAGTALSHGQSREGVLFALEKMAKGGIRDQLGGGFHRYSVDESWSVPHFEKMLYDNGLLLKLYSEALLAPGEISRERRDLFLDVLETTIEWLSREMVSPDGGFYAAQDADSEGEEGKFFVWDPKDLAEHLTPDEARVFARAYGVSPTGNFEHGKTVLYIAEFAPEAERALLAQASAKLLVVRAKRIAPALDDKILTAWNGLMISGLAWAGQALAHASREERANEARRLADRAYDFITAKVATPGDLARLHATYQRGQAKLNAYLDDYAFMAMAALDLSRFEPTVERSAKLVAQAGAWINTVISRFGSSSQANGYYFTSDDHEQLLQRPKTLHDQAIPSGTGVVLECLIGLVELKHDDSRFYAELERQAHGLWIAAEQQPLSSGQLLSAFLLREQGAILVGGPKSSGHVIHPNIYKDPNLLEKLQICHRGTCSLNPSQADIQARTRFCK